MATKAPAENKVDKVIPLSTSASGNPAEENTAAEGQISQALKDDALELAESAENIVEDHPEAAEAGSDAQRSQSGRNRPTARQRQRTAARQRDFGERQLARTYTGIPVVEVKVTFMNQVISTLFTRSWAYIDTCAYMLERHGNFTVGDKAAQQLLESLNGQIDRLVDEMKALYAQVGEVAVQAAMKDDAVQVTFTSAFEKSIQVRSKVAKKAIDGFVYADKFLVELETLVWQDERTAEDVRMELDGIRAKISAIARFVVPTVRRLNAAFESRLNPKAPESSQAA